LRLRIRLYSLALSNGRSWFVAVTRIALCRGRMAAGGFRQPTSPDGEQMKAVGQFD
jgi:hypothetical protein